MEKVDGPCVFIANHMSTLETICLPGVIQPYKDCTFIVKRGIVEYPVFKHLMIARDPVVVDRKNWAEDLKVVLEEGAHSGQRTFDYRFSANDAHRHFRAGALQHHWH
ncbi:MAG: 1-acyl-sn-glycerol-3-phosphate acyltransferase [Caldilineaceae bacterium]